MAATRKNNLTVTRLNRVRRTSVILTIETFYLNVFMYPFSVKFRFSVAADLSDLIIG